MKHIVKVLANQGREQQTLHRKVHRPWRWYNRIDAGERFQDKRILVKGTAAVTCCDKKMLLSEIQSIYIPLGEVHRLTNRGKVPLEIIEVQSGYMCKDDIVRFGDTYDRG